MPCNYQYGNRIHLHVFRYSHLTMVRSLIKMGADVNQRCEEKMTPLHYAAR